MEQFVELRRGNAADRFFLGDHFFFVHVEGHFDGRGAVAFSNAALQHPQAAFLDGKLDVEHVVVVFFEPAFDVVELFVNDGHGDFQRNEVFAVLRFSGFVDGARRAYAGDDVFTLRIDKPFAVKMVVAGGRASRERDAGRG